MTGDATGPGSASGTARIELTDDLRAAARRDDDTGPWFDALAEGTLLLRRCARCSHHARPDAVGCPACRAGGGDLTWARASGRGVVVSRIVDRAGERAGLAPVVLGIVELDEGPWLHARLLPADPPDPPDPADPVDGSPAIGEAVVLVVLTPADGEGEPVPAFGPA